jgi:pimeloyl-ACP methyl ester carboxylesterase
VIDAIGAEKTHLLGYSMGGWISAGVAIHHPERLQSLVIAGWDFVDGMTAAIGTDQIEFEAFMGLAREMAPELTEWVTEAVTEALGPCLSQLYDIEGAAAAVLNLDIPVLLWNGQDDPYHDPMLAFSRQHGLQFFSTDGDHMEAMIGGAPQVLPTLRRFFANACSPACSSSVGPRS